MTTLISFLGVGDKKKGYRTANYQFNDGQIFNNTQYIGLTLVEKVKPTKTIFLGTSGSMWDVFLENAGETMTDEWLGLSEAVASHQVTQEQLEPFSRYLSEKLNTQVHCILIPFAKNEQEQIEILSVLSDHLSDNEQVVLDVTHGFRHLPMLSLVAAKFLKKIKQVDVSQVYYGALEMAAKKDTETDDDKKTPVLELESLLVMLDWVDGLTTFDKDGDYGVFAPLLQKEGLSENDSRLLQEAIFFERNNNSSQAKQKLSTVFNQIDDINTAIFKLFKPQLIKRLDWFKTDNRGTQEQKLAYEYLARQDYLRAVIFAQEGMISEQTIQDKKDPNSYDDRELTRKTLQKNEQQFRFLNAIRNALAHGLGRDANKDLKRILGDESAMKQSLKQRFDNLLK